MSGRGLARVKTLGHAERVERLASSAAISSQATARQNVKRGADRTRFPSANALSEFLHGQGHGRTQKRPGRDSYLASVQPPGPDQPWHSAQPSAVCQLLTNALQHSLYSGCSAAIRDSAPSWPLGSRLHSRWTCTCPRDHPIFKMREGDSPAYVHALTKPSLDLRLYRGEPETVACGA